MFIRQFFASTLPIPAPSSGTALVMGNMNIWVHSDLEITRTENNGHSLLLLGFAIDPDHPEWSNSDVMNHLAAQEFDSMLFYDYFNKLTGRFVLWAHSGSETLVFNDPAAQRQVFYHFSEEGSYLTSSPKLFYDQTDFHFEISEDKRVILNSKRFKRLEQWFPGDEFIDLYLKRLLPNFKISLTERTVSRIPFSVRNMSRRELKKMVVSRIYGAMEGCGERFDKILNAVTAGSDSRLILSLSPPEEKSDFFIYKRENENDTDVQIAEQLAEKKRFNLSIIEPPPLSHEFSARYKEEFLYPRMLSKLRNIEWLKNNFEEKNTVVIAGYAGEMLRASTNSINQFHKDFVSHEGFTDYLHYPDSDYLKSSMERWLKTTVAYLKNCNHLSYLDLFHWEHHMAPYCAQYAYEQDISGVEIFCPLANRDLILNLIHNSTPEERSGPHGIIYAVIDEAAPEWEGIPYNPKTFLKKIKDRLFKKFPLKIVNLWINR